VDFEISKPEDTARLERLAECRIEIEEGKKRSRDGLTQIAKALINIEVEKLYLDAGYTSLNEYCEGELNLDRFAAYRLMNAGRAAMTLEAAGIKEIPAIETQLVLLSKIPTDELADAWRDGLIAMERENIPVTTTSIKRLVDHFTRHERSPVKEKRRGVNPALETYSEAGELALERIGRIAGADVRTGIEQGTLNVPERDLLAWADEDDATLRNLAYYIVDLGWSLAKAKAYEQTIVGEQTPLAAIVRLATARGGQYETAISIDDTTWNVSIYRVAKDA
jgi:hypothetical protein